MNRITKITIFLGLCLTLGFGCTPKDNSSTTTPPKEEVTSKSETSTKPKPTEKTNLYLIEEKSFMGLSPDNSIENHLDILEQSTLQSGEGDFEIYNIKNESRETVGYILPSPKDASKIGIITINTPKASTKEGAKIGMTFKELEAVLGELPVHGSEIESKTYAFKGNQSFLLDAAFNTYEIDKSKLDVDTKIKAIEIRPNAYK